MLKYSQIFVPCKQNYKKKYSHNFDTGNIHIIYIYIYYHSDELKWWWNLNLKNDRTFLGPYPSEPTLFRKKSHISKNVQKLFSFSTTKTVHMWWCWISQAYVTDTLKQSTVNDASSYHRTTSRAFLGSFLSG